VASEASRRLRGAHRRTVSVGFGGLLLGIALGLHSHVFAARTTPGLPAADAERLAAVLEHIRQDYVDPVDEHVLMEAALQGMLGALDGHSALLDRADYDDLHAASEANAGVGVGVDIDAQAGQLRIARTVADSPAALAGIRAGDRLLAVDGIAVDAQHLAEGLARLRGNAGTAVDLLLARGAGGATYELRLERQAIERRTVRGALVTPAVAYLAITRFGASTPTELYRAVRELRAAAGGGRLALVLDLRDNPGGTLDAAVAVAGAFLDSGLIVRGEGRGHGAHFERHATQGDVLAGAPLVVLLNARSASGAEIVAAALKDNHRARILGEPSFGKGTVQSLLPLDAGRALQLTTSRFYTPSGASLLGRGVTPDLWLPTPIADRPGAPQDDPAVRAALLALHERAIGPLAGL
jgi:carboxyl-terminal processing protease